MGVIAESMVTYAQPLLDGAGGSPEDIQRAMTLAQICWNLALLPDRECEAELAELRPSFHMDDSEFEDFRRSVVLPMIQRHHEMFPNVPRIGAKRSSTATPAPPTDRGVALRTERYPGTGRNAPCPCNSGRKYKRCCGR